MVAAIEPISMWQRRITSSVHMSRALRSVPRSAVARDPAAHLVQPLPRPAGQEAPRHAQVGPGLLDRRDHRALVDGVAEEERHDVVLQHVLVVVGEHLVGAGHRQQRRPTQPGRGAAGRGRARCGCGPTARWPRRAPGTGRPSTGAPPLVTATSCRPPGRSRISCRGRPVVARRVAHDCRCHWARSITSRGDDRSTCGSMIQVSLLPPPCELLTMREPSTIATRVRPPLVT